MKKQNAFIGYLLVGIGIYFLLRQLQFPILTNFYSWPTLLIIIGLAFLLHSYIANDYKNLFPGVIVLGLGIHFHGLNHYGFWVDHWGVYPFIIAIAFLLRFQKTKNGLVPGLILLVISLFAIFSTNKPSWFRWVDQVIGVLENFWPVVLIVLGAYLLFRKK
ncbi:LiaI-LiaF-like domain-containing protein [Radiobacillus sp. PE A8.2]|uniref:LiaI-LiaF-like domain-containing protein n=1 Tax=Radiobacillus sp. PE A8.2 TaxID=3380349 RepID=UPI00388E9CEE